MPTVLAQGGGRWPRRYGMMGLLLLALFICYVDRVLISIAGIELQRQFGWSDSAKGLVFSSFFAGYLCLQLTGGVLANRFGGRKVFLLAVLGWSLMTLLMPPAAYLGLVWLILARFLLGVGEGAAYPTSYNLIRIWMPAREISRAVSLTGAAASVGSVFAFLVVGALMEMLGWPAVFYLFGVFGLLWCGLWILFVPAVPIPPLERPQPAVKRDTLRPKIPWQALISHRAVMPLYAVSVAFGSVSFTLASWLPSYFADTYGAGLAEAGLYSTFPWVANALVMVWGGALADRWIQAGRDRLRVRKRLLTLGLVGTAAGCLLVTLAGNALLAAALASLLFGALGMAVPGYIPVAGEIFPRHGEILLGFMAALGSLSSLAVVSLTGVVLDLTGSYDAVFAGLAALCLTATAIFRRSASVDPVLAKDGGAFSTTSAAPRRVRR